MWTVLDYERLGSKFGQSGGGNKLGRWKKTSKKVGRSVPHARRDDPPNLASKDSLERRGDEGTKGRKEENKARGCCARQCLGNRKMSPRDYF